MHLVMALIIPNLPKLCEDEFLVSYLYRIIAANGFALKRENLKQYFPVVWNGMGNGIEDLADQIDMDPIDLFLSTSTFGYDQIFMTREEHKKAVTSLFSDGEMDGSYLPYFNAFQSAYVCKDCWEEAESHGIPSYISRRHQNPIGFCTEHNAYCVHGEPTNLLPLHSSSLPSPSASHVSDFPSGFELNIVRMYENLINTNIPFNFDDLMTLIYNRFQPDHMATVIRDSAMDANEELFFDVKYVSQYRFMSEAYLYFHEHKDNYGYFIRRYKNIFAGLLSASFESYNELLEAIPGIDEIRYALVVSAADQGYELVSEARPIVRVKNLITGVERVVSPYTVLDKELPKQEQIDLS